ncbi:MAG: hypothetical protein NPIRA05_01720 [Nitrospirales bacterium]|nr:MAG: hypothetical protein NPIRA05_01720 [Nitrospirales bacterium]
MMVNVEYIEKTPDLLPSQDYKFLRKAGRDHIEKLAHKLWTDYNVHDPGITILELLCYAITDLGYRTNYDIQDLLSENDRGVQVNRSNFHTARKVFTSNPISFDDLRKLLIDIHGIRNVWIEKHSHVTYCIDRKRQALMDCPVPLQSQKDVQQLNGLYDVFIEYEDFVMNLRGKEKDQNQPRARVGLLDHSGGNGEFIQPGGRGIRFHVAYDLTLLAVSVYSDATGEIGIRLQNKNEDTLFETTKSIDQMGAKTRIPLHVRIKPGEDYRLEAFAIGNSNVHLFRTADPAFPYSQEHVMYLMSGIRGAEIQQPYFFFYDWEITYAVPSRVLLSPEWTVSSVGLTNMSGEGGHIEPQDKGIEFEVYRNLILETVDLYPETSGTVTLRLLDVQEDQEVAQVTVDVDTEKVLNTVSLSFELIPGKTYRLHAQGTTVKLFRNTNVIYPFSQATVIKLINGFHSATAFYFFYNWKVTYSAYPQPSAPTQTDVRLVVKDTVQRFRNLCEDFINICDLDVEDITLCSDIEVTPSADVEEVLAELFYRIDRNVSPGVRFYTIQELLDKGRTTDQIFEGPKLEHGFIDDEEFQEIQRKCEIRASDMIQLIMDIPEVVAVKSLSLLSFIDGQLRAQDEWRLPLATDRFRAPEFSTDRSKIIFYKNDLPYYANRKRVEELLREKQAADFQSKLKGHQTDLPVPVGQDRQLGEYYPIQNELPANYRVGKLRVAESESSLRKAQARQLKAYLMFFEQQLANYLSQLSHVRELFSWEKEDVATYFTQPVVDFSDAEEIYRIEGLAQIIRDHDPAHAALPEHMAPLSTAEEQREYLLTSLLPAALEILVEDSETAYERKGRFLDHLIARFCESFTDYSLLMFNLLKDEAQSRVLEDKRVFLEEYPAISCGRATAYDYRYPNNEANLSGYQYRLYRLLGIQDVTRRNLSGHRFVIERGMFHDPIAGIEKEGWRFALHDDGEANLFTSLVCESQDAIDVLLDFALSIGGDEKSYRPSENGRVIELVRRCADQAKDEAIGATISTDEAVKEEVKKYFQQYGESEGFHVIEHILLRKRTAKDPFLPVQLNKEGECHCVEVKDPYSFRMTIVLPSWSRRFRDAKFRRFVEQSLRFEAPAHIYPKICWISHEHMKSFEVCYSQWAQKLADLDERLGGCRSEREWTQDVPLTGEPPLPVTEDHADYQSYEECLEAFIDKMHSLVTVHPLARLHDCKDVQGDAPQVTLNNTNLGTL